MKETNERRAGGVMTMRQQEEALIRKLAEMVFRHDDIVNEHKACRIRIGICNAITDGVWLAIDHGAYEARDKDGQPCIAFRKPLTPTPPDEDEDEVARQGLRIYSPAGIGVTICSGGGGLGANTGLYLINGEVRPLHPREAARALGFPDSFLLPCSEKEALRLVGNSVAIPVVTMIAKEIARTLRRVAGGGKLAN